MKECAAFKKLLEDVKLADVWRDMNAGPRALHLQGLNHLCSLQGRWLASQHVQVSSFLRWPLTGPRNPSAKGTATEDLRPSRRDLRSLRPLPDYPGLLPADVVSYCGCYCPHIVLFSRNNVGSKSELGVRAERRASMLQSSSPQLHSPSARHLSDLFSDGRTHSAYAGPSKQARIPDVAKNGWIARSEDGTSCVVAGHAGALFNLWRQLENLVLRCSAAGYQSNKLARQRDDRRARREP